MVLMHDCETGLRYAVEGMAVSTAESGGHGTCRAKVIKIVELYTSWIESDHTSLSLLQTKDLHFYVAYHAVMQDGAYIHVF